MNANILTVRKRVWFGLCLAAVLTALSVATAQDLLPAQSIPLDQPVPVDPRITIGYLPNGLRYYVRANARPFQRAELRLVVNVGSVAEDEDRFHGDGSPRLRRSTAARTSPNRT